MDGWSCLEVFFVLFYFLFFSEYHSFIQVCGGEYRRLS